MVEREVVIMDRKEMINYLHKQIGKEGLADLVKQGKITLAEYKEVVGEDCVIDIDTLKAQKIKFIDTYKHEARMYFPYGNVGGIQRFGTEDIMSINLALEGIKMGLITSTIWKYSNGNYEEANEKYLTDMLLKGGMLLTKCFEVEATIIGAINSIEDLEELKAYDEKAEFDKIFFAEDETGTESDSEITVETETATK